MAFSVSVYTDPGVYIQEVLVPGQINIAGQAAVTCLMGVGSRSNQANDEAVVRGFIEDEPITPAAVSPHTTTLEYRASGSADTVIKRNGVTLPGSDVFFQPATIQGTGTVANFTTDYAFGMQMNTGSPVTLAFFQSNAFIHRATVSDADPDEFPGPIYQPTEGGTFNVSVTSDVGGWTGGVVTIYGTNAVGAGVSVAITPNPAGGTVHDNTVDFTTITSIVKATVGAATDTVTVGVSDGAAEAAAVGVLGSQINIARTDAQWNANGAYNAVDAIDLAEAINAGLSLASGTATAADLGYGAAYGSVAASSTPLAINGVLVLDTESTGATATASDVRVFDAVDNSSTGAATFWLTTDVLDAQSVIGVSNGAYVAGATYECSYVVRDADQGISGTAGAISGAGGTVTLTDAGATFVTEDVGKYITIRNAANTGNDGRFLILSRPGATSVTFVNADAVNEPAVPGVDWTTEPESDSLTNEDVTDVVMVGSFAGTDNYVENTSFTAAGDAVDWNFPAIGAQAVFLSGVTPAAGDYAGATFSANAAIRLSIDNGTAFDAVFCDLHPTLMPLGYTPRDISGLISTANIRDNLNALIANNVTNGPLAYRSAVDLSTLTLRLSSQQRGTSSRIQILPPSGSTPVEADSPTGPVAAVPHVDESADLLGTNSNTTDIMGVGSRPTPGSTYFVTYDYVRAASDYNLVRQSFSLEQAYAAVGSITTTNPLAKAAMLAFSNGAPSIITIQINNATNQPGSGDSTGNPTISEVRDALDASTRSSVPTEMVLIDTAGTPLANQIELYQHVENQSGPLEKNYRRGYYGMTSGTQIGDKDTAGTLLFRAGRTLQYSANSPGRGRATLLAPAQLAGMTISFSTSDGTNVAADPVDGTYLATALAAKLTSLLSPSDALIRRTLANFDTTTITNPLLKAERHQLANGGVTVVTYDAGRFILLDPITTERAGGAMPSFEQIQGTVMRDNVTRKVEQALDSNIVGIVPTDLTSFVIDIKQVVASVLSGEISAGAIGPFRDSSGATRPIDIATDIEVSQDANDPTQFSFNYYYYLRYPALRLFGQYSVDNPFFQTS